MIFPPAGRDLATPAGTTSGLEGTAAPRLPPYVTAKRALKHWRSLGATRWVLKNLTKGA